MQKKQKPQATDSFSDTKDAPLLWLLLRGELSPSMFSEQRFFHLRPVVEAVIYLQSKGETAPFTPQRVWKIARERYNAADVLQEKLKEVHAMVPDRPWLKVIQDRLTYEKLLDVVANQLATGAYDHAAIVNLLDKNTNSTELPVLKLRKPARTTDLVYPVKSGLTQVDRVIGGFGNELVIVAAGQKQGKTNCLINIAARQPKETIVIYVTIEDYGFEEINTLLQTVQPGLFQEKDNLYIADWTGYSPTIYDVEKLVKNHAEPGIPMLVIVDRAEKCVPMGKYQTDSNVYNEVFSTLRRIAKRYQCVVLVDSQLGSMGYDDLNRSGVLSSRFIYNDHTVRQSLMDLFIGLRRNEKSVTLFLEGRRQGKLPAIVDIPTNELGVYQV